MVVRDVRCQLTDQLYAWCLLDELDSLQHCLSITVVLDEDQPERKGTSNLGLEARIVLGWRFGGGGLERTRLARSTAAREACAREGRCEARAEGQPGPGNSSSGPSAVHRLATS